MNTIAQPAEGWIKLPLEDYLSQQNEMLNPFTLIGQKWMLIAAGTASDWNGMTASWGTMGVLWNKPVVTCYVRPTRHTFKYIDTSSVFSISFFLKEYRHVLEYFGSHSGRNENKALNAGVHPVYHVDDSIIGFTEACVTFSCHKLYAQDFNPALFLDPSIEKNYSNNDYHRMYIGEITGVWLKENS